MQDSEIRMLGFHVAMPSNIRLVIHNSCSFSEASQCFPFFIFFTPNEKEMQDLRCTRSSHLNESSCYFKKHGTCDSQKLQFQRSVPLSSSCKIHIARLNTRQMPDCRQYWRKQFKVTSGWKQCQVRCEWQQLQFELGRCSTTPTTQIQSGRTEGEDKQKLKHTSAAAREKKNPKYC